MRWVTGVAVLALSLASSGCFSTSKPFPEKHYYVLELPDPASEFEPRPGGLKVSRFRVSSAYEGRGLTYRLSDTEYQSDYYHEYFTSPATLFTDAVRHRLAASARFQPVVSSSSIVDTRFTLEGVVSAAYGDLRDPDAPASVLHLQFLVIDVEDDHRIVLNETYRETEPCASAEPAALVAGINRALARAVADLENKLGGI